MADATISGVSSDDLETIEETIIAVNGNVVTKTIDGEVIDEEECDTQRDADKLAKAWVREVERDYQNNARDQRECHAAELDGAIDQWLGPDAALVARVAKLIKKGHAAEALARLEGLS
jgi:hypothetical protein